MTTKRKLETSFAKSKLTVNFVLSNLRVALLIWNGNNVGVSNHYFDVFLKFGLNNIIVRFLCKELL